MIVIDGIVFSFHGEGGVGVVFESILNGLEDKAIDYVYLNYGGRIHGGLQSKQRLLERYRQVKLPVDFGLDTIFHSSYYRIPADRRYLTVTTVHDFIYEKHMSGLPRVVHSIQKFDAIRNSDAIVCVSENTKSDLLHFLPDVDPRKIHVIYNGISPDYYVLDDSLSCVEDYVLFVGSRSTYKNFDLAVKAVADLGTTHLVCVGGGAFTSQELDLIALYLGGRCRHVGFVDNSSLNLLYSKAKCLLYPSSYEGFGIPILEAMSAGCPVIAYNSSSIPEISAGAAFLCDELIVGSFTDAIKIFDDFDCRRFHIDAGLKRVADFSWEKSVDLYIDVYKSLLS